MHTRFADPAAIRAASAGSFSTFSINSRASIVRGIIKQPGEDSGGSFLVGKCEDFIMTAIDNDAWHSATF